MFYFLFLLLVKHEDFTVGSEQTFTMSAVST